MSWRPFFDIEQLNALREQITDHPQGAGRGGLTCPPQLVQKSLEEFSYVVASTKTGGNCTVQAFTQNAIAQGIRPSWKRMQETKRCGDARKLACKWASKNKDEKIWGGWSFAEIAQSVSHQPFDKWLSRLRLTDSWGDVAFVHALACAVGVDVLLIDSTQQAKLIGKSLMVGQVGQNECCSLVPMAFHEHFHFWAALPMESRPAEQVAITVSPSSLVSYRGSQDLECDLDFDQVEPNKSAISFREQELQLREALVEWSPFELPSPKLIQCCQTLGCFH